MKIVFKVLATGKMVALDVEPSDTTEMLKLKLADSEGVPLDAMRLIYRGKQLQPNITVAGAGVQKDSMLHLVLKLQQQQKKHEVTVRSTTGRMFTMDVSTTTTIGQAISQFEELLNVPAGEHVLVYNGRKLTESQQVGQFELPASATAHLILKARELSASATAGPLVVAAPADVDRTRVYGELGTLYAKCGGIFGVAGFVDRCMDKWMADSLLNANEAVATWHGRSQRCGFKFLVTQLMGYLSGGPQRYTGKSMALAHKWLNILPDEWSVFMDLFREVCSEFGLPQEMVDDLAALLNSMEADCVVHAGEDVPPNPGPAVPAGQSLFARLGGVYPIALFTDRLVDALLGDKRVRIPVDGQKRNECSLKYLLTEMVCKAAGGPEEISGPTCTETYLLLPEKKVFFVLNAAKDSSDHWPCANLRTELVTCIYGIRHLICDPERATRMTSELRERMAKVSALGDRTGMPLIYVPQGGVVKLDFDASPKLQQQVREGLTELGLVAVEKTKVKSANAAAAGNMLSAATIAARYAAPGAFVAARKRVLGDPRTLYGKGGGVFGLAKLADKLMDDWMADPTLNANPRVAMWHQSAQKFGFKFLVTQIFGYLTGGPQRYTGQPMDVAHKHLGITRAEWDSFMRDADRVYTHFGLDVRTQNELRAICNSTRDIIIVGDGEVPPLDPHMCRKRPDGSTLYAACGGVYPLAMFADGLVEAVLKGDQISVQHTPVSHPTSRRHPPGLKYVVTELICSGAGGPEVVTSKGFDEAKLGIKADDWPVFLHMVEQEATKLFPDQAVRTGLQVMFEEQKPELCIGVVSEDMSEAALARKKLRDAGFGHVDTTAALLHCRGNADTALDLLVSGWQPDTMAPTSVNFGGAGVCPFRRPSGAAGSAASAPGTPTTRVGRVLDNELQLQLDLLLVEEADLCCPITLLLFHEPVIASDGCVYERVAIQELIQTGVVSPLTMQPLTPQLTIAHQQKEAVDAFMRLRTQEMLNFAFIARKQGEPHMAKIALERAGEYITQLTPSAVPEMAQSFETMLRDAGLNVPSLDNAFARIHQVLRLRVQQVTAELAVQHEEDGDEGDGKSVLFCIDVSGSMRTRSPINSDSASPNRLDKARENCLKIFDEYLDESDEVSLLTFCSFCHTDIPLANVGGNRSKLRGQLDSKLRKTRGKTHFFDALCASEQVLRSGKPGSKQWIVALTDGATGGDSATMHDAIAKLRASPGKPDLIVVGVDLERNYVPVMKELTAVTPTSLFIDASGGVRSLDEAFEQVAEMICE